MKFALIFCLSMLLMAAYMTSLGKDKIDRRAALHVDPYNPQNYAWHFEEKEER